MILIALGSNLPSPEHGSPRAVLEAALGRLLADGRVRLVRRSRWYESAPVPASDQPWFVNGVALVETDLPPGELLERLHAVEAAFGRVRAVRNEARILDLDLIAYGELVTGAEARPALPHPRLAERAFVLLPLAEVAPGWRDPRSGETVETLVARLPVGQQIRPMGG